MVKTVLDKPPKKIWNVKDMRVNEQITGIPSAEHFKNRNNNNFIVVGLDYGHAVCRCYYYLNEYPKQEKIDSYFLNTYLLYREYLKYNPEEVGKYIDWDKVIEWLNKIKVMRFTCIGKNKRQFVDIKTVVIE